MKPAVIKTEEAMIFTGHHWLVSHAKRLQDELVAYRAAAESIFAALETEIESCGEDGAPAQWVTDAYLALFDLLDKAPAPENLNPSGGDLPF